MNLSSNRIQQNAARNNRPAPNRPAAAQRPPVAQANTLSNYGTTTRVRSLYVGQILKGEVSDLRNREIVLTLENNTTVSAHLEGGNWLAIGEISAFKVLSASQEQITLEALPRTDMSLANSTVQKALEEAGLPVNPKNQQIVLELMKNQLPIHKQAIQQMLQKSFQHKEVSIPTLVLMSKHKIPITSQNAIQFEQYQQNAHSLATGLENLAKDLSTVIRDLAVTLSDNNTNNTYMNVSAENPSFMDMADMKPISEYTAPDNPKAQVIEQLFQHTANVSSATANHPMQTTVAQILSSVLNEDFAMPNTVTEEQSDTTVSPSPATLPDQTLSLFNESERTELISILENFDLPEELREKIADGSASLRQVITVLQEDYEQAMMLDKESLSGESLSEESISEGTQKPEQQKAENLMLRTTLFETAVVKHLESHLQVLQAQTQELGSRFPIQERVLLKEYLKDFPIDDSVKKEIADGTLPTEDFLRTIKNVLPFTKQETAIPLLSSQLFSDLIEDSFLEHFFLTPQKIFAQGGVNSYYHKLTKQLENLDSLFEKNLHMKSPNHLQQIINSLSIDAKEQVSHIKNNLDFMKILNQFFPYIQLPTKIQEKYTHADLYVYTKKKNLQQNPHSIRVLLHLTTENLGTLDIQVSLQNRNITTVFHTENEKTGKLISTNFPLLEEALGNLGYTSTHQIAKLEKNIDIVNDFIAPESAGHAISRYSFDLRA